MICFNRVIKRLPSTVWPSSKVFQLCCFHMQLWLVKKYAHGPHNSSHGAMEKGECCHGEGLIFIVWNLVLGWVHGLLGTWDAWDVWDVGGG